MARRGITPEIAREIRKANGREETRLQKARLQAGLSQAQLAEKSKVALRMIRGYEQRERTIDKAQLDTLCKLSDGLDCTIADILESDELIAKYQKVR